MSLGLLIALIVLTLAVLVIQIIQLKRGANIDLSPVGQMFAAVEKAHERRRLDVELVGKLALVELGAAAEDQQRAGARQRQPPLLDACVAREEARFPSRAPWC